MDDLFMQSMWNKFNKHIALIGNPNEFLIKCMTDTFKEKKYTVHNVIADVNSIQHVPEDVKIYFLIVDDPSTMAQILVYLKDLVLEKNICICAVCEKTDLPELYKYIRADQIAMTFYRPVNVNDIISKIDQVYEDVASKPVAKKILVVDDDPEFLKHMQQLLRKRYRVFLANSGASAIMVLAKHKADLILLDCQMPVLDGLKTMEALRLEEGMSDIPVMFLTGKHDRETVLAATALKPEKYILKTTSADSLLNILDSYFTEHLSGESQDLLQLLKGLRYS